MSDGSRRSALRREPERANSSQVKGTVVSGATSLIQLCVLALILTPVTRVAMSIMLFSAGRDGVFVLITSVVLAVLVAGLIGVI